MTGQRGPGAFHIGGGAYAQRNADGSVTILSAAYQEETHIPAKTWARLVASVSAGGYSHESYEVATALHKGG